MPNKAKPLFVFVVYCIVALGLTALVLLTLNSRDSREVFIEVPQLEPKSSFERVNIALVFHNFTAGEVQICGVQACCGLRHIAVPKLVAANSSDEIIFEGIFLNGKDSRDLSLNGRATFLLN